MSEATNYLIAKVQHLLLEEWDPIGIKDVPEAANEYDSYVQTICVMLRGGCSYDEIYRHLRWIEVDHIGLDEDDCHTTYIAKRLMGLRASNDI